MEGITVVVPSWIERLGGVERTRTRLKFLLKIAAVLCTPEGTMHALSRRIGMHPNSLNTMLNAGRFDNGLPVHTIKAIEQHIGVGTIPRSLLNQEIYGDM